MVPEDLLHAMRRMREADRLWRQRMRELRRAIEAHGGHFVTANSRAGMPVTDSSLSAMAQDAGRRPFKTFDKA